MKTITNMKPAKKCSVTSVDLKKANDLNDFYLRFETDDFTAE